MSEFSEDFVMKMRNRMLTSFYKYGAVEQNYDRPDKETNVSAIASLKKRLENYEIDGNTEWLVDAANFAMIEFMCPQHPKAHFRATSSEESPGLEGLSIKEKEKLDETINRD